MASLTELGGTIFVTMIFVNFFFLGFGGQNAQGTFSGIVTDQNVTSQSTVDGQFTFNSDAISQTTGQTNSFDFVIQSVGGALVNIISWINAALFGFTDIAEKMFPNSIMLAIIYPLKIFMIIYSVIVAGYIKSLIFGGGGGSI